MIKLNQVVRGHVAMKEMIDGKSSKFLKPSVLYSSMDHKLAAAYEDLTTAKSVQYKAHIDRYYKNLEPLFLSIKVDGQEVARSSTQKVRARLITDRDRDILSHYVDEDAIRKFAKPAPFGKGDKTVYDEHVRKALEIEASRVEIEYGPDFDGKVIAELDKLSPRGKKLVPKLYKIHIYETGGRFLRHQDTLHADNHYATLIIALPTKYEGGEFVLHVDGEDKSFDLSGTCYNATNNFLCFLTDLPHEVREVMDGMRIVLQYDLYLEDASPNSEKQSDALTSDDTHKTDWSCRSALAKSTPTVMESGTELERRKETSAQIILPLLDEFMKEKPSESVCFLLTHEYPLSIEHNMLKAADRVLYDLISSKYEVELGLAFNSIETDWDGRFPSLKEARKLNVMDFGCIENFRKFVAGGQEETDSDEHKGKVHVFVGDVSFFQTIKSEECIEYTGNEACPGQYVYASVVLSVGPRREY